MRPAVVLAVVALGTLGSAVHEASAREGGSGRSLTLADAISAARSRSAGVLEARAGAEGAEAAADASLSGYLPSIGGTVSGSRDWSYAFAPKGPTSSAGYQGGAAGNYNAVFGAQVRWAAYDFGRTSSNVGAARAENKSAASHLAAESDFAAKTAATLFLTAVFDEELVSVAQATLLLRERHATLSRALVAAGTRPPVEEARARVELAAARIEVTTAERNVAADRVRLATALMIDPTVQLSLVRPSVLPTVAGDVRRAEEDAVQRRPDLRSAEASVESQEEKLGFATAERLPRFDFALDAQQTSNKSDDYDRFLPNRRLVAGLTATIPIFDWAVWGAIPVQRAQVSAAQARAAGLRARVRGEAADAMYGIHSARSAVEQAKAYRELAGATLAVMEARYQAGLASPFDLFDAAKKDSEARTETIRAELQLAQATVEALAATGRIGELTR